MARACSLARALARASYPAIATTSPNPTTSATARASKRANEKVPPPLPRARMGDIGEGGAVMTRAMRGDDVHTCHVRHVRHVCT